MMIADTIVAIPSSAGTRVDGVSEHRQSDSLIYSAGVLFQQLNHSGIPKSAGWIDQTVASGVPAETNVVNDELACLHLSVA